ncbi:unnamed protein product [Miscanthus lutarioriparius]|uniref:Uncharacterized protein n=1 Tax=Miscanthus lutarioriparius TaxID=422564 RepID=A0A811RFS3_9POAL|nr:unnamed protein product [Miscanthus lutarioriparius]
MVVRGRCNDNCAGVQRVRDKQQCDEITGQECLGRQVTIVTCSFILQNNSVPQEQRATANGLATTLMSFFKAFAPAGAGIVFSWAQKRQHAFLFPGDQMVFFLLDIVIFVELIWTFKPFLAIPEQTS